MRGHLPATPGLTLVLEGAGPRVQAKLGDRERQGVGGIGRGQLRQAEHGRDHPGDLTFLRLTVAGQGTFDLGRGMLAHEHAAPLEAQEHDTARVAQLGRTLRILVEEDAFDRSDLRLVLGDDLVQAKRDLEQAYGQRGRRRQTDHPMCKVNQALATALHHAPAEVPRAGIDAEGNHVERLAPYQAARRRAKRYRDFVASGRTLRFRVPVEVAGLRLDQALANLSAEISRTEARRLIAKGSVFLAGARVKVAGRVVRSGQALEVHLSPIVEAPQPAAPPPQIPILLSTPELLVVDKPSGVLSAPTPETDQADLLHFLRPSQGELHLVHRLDAPTSGVLVLARTPKAARALAEQLETRTLSRKYVAFLAGAIEADFTANEPIQGKSARTQFRVRERTQLATWVEAELDTGRTHQIRIHAKASGHPVLGDRRYGAPLPSGMPRPSRLALHAAEVRFIDPTSARPVDVSAPFPADLARYWAELAS